MELSNLMSQFAQFYQTPSGINRVERISGLFSLSLLFRFTPKANSAQYLFQDICSPL